jgi:hypothetical protein
MPRLALVTVAAIAALVFSGSALADYWSYEGIATGRTVPIGDQKFLAQGTLTSTADPGALIGTYRATYTLLDSGFTTCPYLRATGAVICEYDLAVARCNLITESSLRITLVGGGRVQMPLSLDSYEPFIRASVCLHRNDLADTTTHYARLYGFDVKTPPTDTVGDLGSVTFGMPDWTYLFVGLRGFSTPLGDTGIYEDRWEFYLAGY